MRSLPGGLRARGNYPETEGKLQRITLVGIAAGESEETMKILIDNRACGNPLTCLLCLDRCPEKVFGTYARRPRLPGAPAGDWIVSALFVSQCTGCRECVAFCPQKAISVE